MKAILKNYRQSPRKVRLLADLIRGKRVDKATEILSFVNKRATDPFMKVLASAVANAKNLGKDVTHLVVNKVTVDEGATLKRFRPRARGSAARILKRCSHVCIELASK